MSMPRISSALATASSRVGGELDATGLAAATGLDLGLDDHPPAVGLGRGRAPRPGR